MGGGFNKKPGTGGLVHGSTTQLGANAPDPGMRTLTEQLGVGPPVPRSARSEPAQANGAAVQHVDAQGITGAGGKLPHAETIQGLFGRHEIGNIEAHVGGDAATASRAIGAEAYAIGHHVAFASEPSLHTAAHEAAHVVQQRRGVQMKGSVGERGDAHEQHADQVADAVAAGRSAEALLDGYAGGSARSPAVQRKSPDDAHGAEPAPKPPQMANAARLIQLLAAPPPAPGGRDDVFTLLSGLSVPDLLAAMEGATDAGRLPQLHARVITWTNPFFVAKLLSALYAVELVRVPPSAVLNAQLKAAGMALDLLPQDQQIQILEYVLHHRGAGVSVTELYEGALAMRESKTRAGVPMGHNETAASVGPMAGTLGEPGPVEPGPWAPPGKQPIPLYIGNNAHARIAATYQAAHGSDVVRTNSVPLKSILNTLAGLLASQGKNVDKSALSDDEIGLVPDIMNLTRLHLYEIKPLAAQGAGAAKASAYVGLFAKAGVTVALGPTTEPGTQGGLPAPGGVFMFWSPQPGVIVYQYRKGRLVPVPVPDPEPAAERRWKFELQPLTPQQKQMVTTLTVGGILLMVATMILLAPVGA